MQEICLLSMREKIERWNQSVIWRENMKLIQYKKANKWKLRDFTQGIQI